MCSWCQETSSILLLLQQFIPWYFWHEAHTHMQALNWAPSPLEREELSRSVVLTSNDWFSFLFSFLLLWMMLPCCSTQLTFWKMYICEDHLSFVMLTAYIPEGTVSNVTVSLFNLSLWRYADTLYQIVFITDEWRWQMFHTAVEINMLNQLFRWQCLHLFWISPNVNSLHGLSFGISSTGMKCLETYKCLPMTTSVLRKNVQKCISAQSQVSQHLLHPAGTGKEVEVHQEAALGKSWRNVTSLTPFGLRHWKPGVADRWPQVGARVASAKGGLTSLGACPWEEFMKMGSDTVVNWSVIMPINVPHFNSKPQSMICVGVLDN